MITIAHAHKSGVIFIFSKSFQTKKITALRPNMTKNSLKEGRPFLSKPTPCFAAVISIGSSPWPGASCTHARAHKNTHSQTRARAHTHTHTHTHTHKQTNKQGAGQCYCSVIHSPVAHTHGRPADPRAYKASNPVEGNGGCHFDTLILSAYYTFTLSLTHRRTRMRACTNTRAHTHTHTHTHGSSHTLAQHGSHTHTHGQPQQTCLSRPGWQCCAGVACRCFPWRQRGFDSVQNPQVCLCTPKHVL